MKSKRPHRKTRYAIQLGLKSAFLCHLHDIKRTRNARHLRWCRPQTVSPGIHFMYRTLQFAFLSLDSVICRGYHKPSLLLPSHPARPDLS